MKDLVAGRSSRSVPEQESAPGGAVPGPLTLTPPPAAPDPAIADVANDLEDAGWLGLTAAAVLGTFLLDGKPGALAATETGLVWTKTINSGEEGQSYPFGIGRLKVNGGAVTAALGINWEENQPTQFSLLVSFLSGNAITLEIDRKYAVQADRKTRDLPGGAKELIGYQNANQPLVIPFPQAAIEFTFQVQESGGIRSSLKVYQSLHNSQSSDIIRIPLPDKVIVIPSLGNTGLVVNDLILDLSATGVSDFVTRFPEVYTPEWKGLGAKEVSILVPVDDDAKVGQSGPVHNEFIIASAEGFLLDFRNGHFSGKVSGSFNNTSATSKLKTVELDVDIRDNEFVRGDFAVTLDLAKATEETRDKAARAPAGGLTAKQAERANSATSQTGDAVNGMPQNPLNGLVRFKGGLIWQDIGDRSVIGVDLTMESLALEGQQPVTHLTGLPARVALWTAAGAFAVYQWVSMFLDEDGGKFASASGLTLFTLIDLFQYFNPPPANGKPALPQLQRIDFPKIGFRYLRITRDEDQPADPSHVAGNLFELYADIGVSFKIDSQIGDAINALITGGMASGAAAVNVFGADLNSAKLTGPIGCRFSNLHLRLLTNDGDVEFMPAMDEPLRAILGERPVNVTVTELPAIDIGGGQQGTATASPKPVVGIQLLKKTATPENQYGLAILLKGLGNEALSIPGVAAGLALYFWPEFEIEFVSQLALEPKFRFIIPPICYLEGVVDLGKPIPDFGGSQNRVSVDVGLIHTDIKAGDKLQGDKLKALADFKKYKYVFGGEYAWGDATGPASHPYPFKFSFAEVHYEGKSPIFSVGSAGVFGLGGLLGRNIAPGIAGGDSSAQGIANWVASDAQAFSKVMNWPDIPASDGSTWHPSRSWADDKDQWAVGLFVKGGSSWDSAKTASVSSILLVGFPDFWVALAGSADVRPIQQKLALVMAYEHATKSLFARASIEYRIAKTDGKKIKAKLPFTLSAKDGNCSLSLGHYLDQQGGPGEASLFNLYTTKFYYVFDSKELTDFGLVPVSNLQKPNIPGPAIGVGALWQLGPKKYGPSWLNLSLFGALGFNLALGFNPFIVFGELYAVGYIQLKVFCFKAKLELAARLYGMTGSQAHRFAGEIMVRLGLPWPFDDIEESFDFFIGSGGPPIQEPALESSAAALNRLESVSRDLSDDGSGTVPVIPIDAIVALRFNKPIYEVNHQPEAGVQKTLLTTNDYLNGNSTQPLPPAADLLAEKTVTKFVSEDYEISYKYVLDRLIVERETAPGVFQTVGQMAASWEPPAAYDENGQPTAEHHHVLYLNTFMPPEAQFSAEALGQLQKWITEVGYVEACQVPSKVCLLDGDTPKPEIETSGPLYRAEFRTAQGSARVREVSVNTEQSDLVPVNLGRLSWNGMELILPEATRIEVPDSSLIDMSVRLKLNHTVREMDGYVIFVSAHLRGRSAPEQLRIVLKANAGTPCGFALDLGSMTFDPQVLGVNVSVQSCQSSGNAVVYLELEAKDALIDGLSVRGPFVQLKDNFPPEDASAGIFQEFLDLTMQLSLTQLCFKRGLNERSQWGKTCIAGCDGNGGPLPTGQGIDAIWQNQLLQPNTSYAIRYRVRTFGASQILRADEADDPPDKEQFVKDSNDAAGSVFRTVRFRTEAAPSQDIKKYIGFTFPSERSTPVYATGLAPLVTLKNRGLIRKIYERHYGSDVLRPNLVDLEGNTIQPVKTQGLDAGSSPFDEWLEQMAENCLPAAQTYTHTQMEVWEKNLKPAMNYSLQLADTSQGASRAAWSVSFQTSRFAKFQDHVAHAQDVLNDAPTLPVFEPAQSTLSAIIGGVMNGSRPGFDNAVEEIYRSLLGVSNGRIGSAAILGEWGVALELDEPLFGKEGVRLLNLKPGTEGLAERGIYLTQQGTEQRLILRDRSGSRVLVFNSPDGSTFQPLGSNAVMSLEFSQQHAVTASVTDYVNRTLFHKTPAERQQEVSRIIDQLTTTSETSSLFDVATGSLALSN